MPLLKVNDYGDSLEGLTCFECSKPAQCWRMFKSPILPWCYKCEMKCRYPDIIEDLGNDRGYIRQSKSIQT